MEKFKKEIESKIIIELEKLRKEIESRIIIEKEKLKNELIKWILGTFLGQTIIIITAIVAIFLTLAK
ncbi:MAG: hypothetical protein ABIL49_03790 [candidate division WOR-3 bacterium]